MSLPLCRGCSLTWSVFVSVRMCQMSCWRILVDLIAQGCVPMCLGTLHGAQTFLTGKNKGRGEDTFCGSDHRKITKRADIFWEKRAKLSCLTSLIDALPRNLSPQRVNRVARSKVEGEGMWYIRFMGFWGSVISKKERRESGQASRKEGGGGTKRTDISRERERTGKTGHSENWLRTQKEAKKMNIKKA